MDLDGLKKDFLSIFGESKNPIRSVKAPGRINLIGEHTDYNEGFVLPVAIDRFIFMAGRARNDGKIILYANDQNEKVKTDLNELSGNKKNPWANYLLGVYHVLKKEKYKLKGVEIFFTGDIPQGRGLSSSAALEVAACYILSLLFDLKIKPVKIAKICKKGENEFVGMPCGIMDQFISVLGKKDNALYLDCRSLHYEYVPFKSDEISIMITDSKVKRELTASAYKQRRKECYTAVKLLKKYAPELNSLRDLSIEQFNRYKNKLPAVLKKRVKHVIFENERVNKGIRFINHGQLDKLGNLMYESHISLKDDYEVSCRELDILVEIAKISSGVIGSRMTGAGFGGSTVTLIQKQKNKSIRDNIKEQYSRKTGIIPDIYICDIVNGVEEII